MSDVPDAPDVDGHNVPPLRFVSVEYPAVAFKLPLFASAADRRTFLAGYQETGLANMSVACVAARGDYAESPSGFDLFSKDKQEDTPVALPNERDAFLLCAPQFRAGAFAIAHDATVTSAMLHPNRITAKMGAGAGDQCTNGKASLEELSRMISAHLDYDQLKGDGDAESDSSGGPSVEAEAIIAARAGPARSSVFADGSAGSNSFAHVLRDGLPKLLQVELFGWDKADRVALHGRNIPAVVEAIRDATNNRKNDSNNGDDSRPPENASELSKDELTCSLPSSRLEGLDLDEIARKAKDLRFSLDAAVVGNRSDGHPRIEYMHGMGRCVRGLSRYVTMKRGYLCNMAPEYHPLLSGAVRARLDAVPVSSVAGRSASSHNSSIHLGMRRSGDVNAAAATGATEVRQKLDRIVWFTRGEFKAAGNIAKSESSHPTASRNAAANHGRMISAPEALRKSLQAVAEARGLRLEIVEKPPAYTVSELRLWWSGVRLLLGAHGSAMYNGGFFMRPGRSDVVEIMNSNQAQGGKASSWLFAASHDVRFSRVYGEPSNPKLDGWAANITLNHTKLVKHVEQLLDDPPDQMDTGFALLDDSPSVSSSYYASVISPEAYYRFMGWIN